MALALAPLAALSSCLTGALWRGYAWPEPVVTEQRIDRQSTLGVGTLTASLPVLENGLWWRSEPEAKPQRWWLGQQVGAGAGAEFVAALLADADFCEVHFAAIDAERRNVGEEVLGDEAQLELSLRVKASAIGEVIPTASVSPAAARVLATARHNAFVLAADPGADLPVLYRRCAERLSAVDLRGLVGERNEVYVEAWGFVDAAGRPAFGLSQHAVALLPAANDENAPLADRLTALRELALLVRVRHGQAATVLRLRPDRLWLLSGLHAEGETFTHHSSWHLQSQPLRLAAPPAANAPRIASTLRLQQDQYARSIQPVLLDGELLLRVAMTPVTLALDVVLGPGAGDFLNWLVGTDFPIRGRKQQHN